MGEGGCWLITYIFTQMISWSQKLWTSIFISNNPTIQQCNWFYTCKNNILTNFGSKPLYPNQEDFCFSQPENERQTELIKIQALRKQVLLLFNFQFIINGKIIKSGLSENLSLHPITERSSTGQCVREFVKFSNLFCESKPHRRICRSYSSASSSVSSVAFISTIFAGNHTFDTNNWHETNIISHRRVSIANTNTKKITNRISVANKSHVNRPLHAIRVCNNCLSFVGAIIHRWEYWQTLKKTLAVKLKEQATI